MRASFRRRKTVQEAMNGRQVNHAFTVFGKEFIVLAEPTIGTEPGE